MCRKAELVYEVLKEVNGTKLLDEWSTMVNNTLPPMHRMSKKTLGTMIYILKEQGKCAVKRYMSCGNIFYEIEGV